MRSWIKISNKKELINKRVRHKCNDPECKLTGKIIDVKKRPDISMRGRFHIWWVLVDWDEKGNIPPGYKQYVPLNRVEIIEELS